MTFWSNSLFFSLFSPVLRVKLNCRNHSRKEKLMHDNYILKILEFQGFDIEFVDVKTIDIKGVNTICIFAKRKEKADEIISCPRCGSVSIYKKSYSIRTIRHLSAFKCSCIIKLNQKRYECKDCGHKFYIEKDF